MSYKPGDRIAIDTSRYGNPSYSITTVVRVTPTGRIVVKWGNGTATFDNRGWEIGNTGYGRMHLCPVTPEIEQQVERDKLLNTLRGIKWETLDTDKLRQIVELVK